MLGKLFIAGMALAVLAKASGAFAETMQDKEATCLSHSLNTADKAECAHEQAARAGIEMQASFEQALSAATDLSANGWNVDFRPQIKEAQALWSQWREAQCALEADLVMGSAAGVVGGRCRERLARERAQALDEIATSIRGSLE